jgi:hypothetical protein
MIMAGNRSDSGDDISENYLREEFMVNRNGTPEKPWAGISELNRELEKQRMEFWGDRFDKTLAVVAPIFLELAMTALREGPRGRK